MELIKVENYYIFKNEDFTKKIFTLFDEADSLMTFYEVMAELEDIFSCDIFSDKDIYIYDVLNKIKYNEKENQYFIFLHDVLNNTLYKICIYEII